MKVLVTDDCPAIQSLYAVILRANHITRIDFAQNANESRKLFCENAYDAIFLDIELQDEEICGIDLLRELRQKVGSAIPIFMVSTLSDRSTVQKCLQCGATAYIEKGQNFFHDIEAALEVTGYRLSA